MIINALVDYYESLQEDGADKTPQPGWESANVAIALALSPSGELIQAVPLLREVQSGKKTRELPLILEVPERAIRSSGIYANFLCDNSSYVLGIDNKGKPSRAIECFEACKKLHIELLSSESSLIAQAVTSFFTSWNPGNAKEHPALSSCLDTLFKVNMVFMVDGEYAQDELGIRQAWNRHYERNANSEMGFCAITGKHSPVARLHGKLKGVTGAQSAGASLISCNDTAFESYGSSIAPMSEYASFAHVTALNKLLADKKHQFRIGDSTVVYWIRGGQEEAQNIFSFSLMPSRDTEAELSNILERLSKGRTIGHVDLDTQFYVLALSPNSARVSVRFFLQDTFGAMLKHLRAHYERLEIEKAPYELRYLSIPMLLHETVNPYSKDKAASPLLSGEVLRAILGGGLYPSALYQAIMLRIRAERNINWRRVAIIKAFLIQQLNDKQKEALTVSLNPDCNNRAYVLGRLFAVLERAQQESSPGINTTIKDRYFTSACATPQNVFPTLLKLANYHTAKVESGKWRDKDISELMVKLDTNDPFPAYQSQNEQGLFILGYYHQTQARYTKKEEKEHDGDNK